MKRPKIPHFILVFLIFILIGLFISPILWNEWLARNWERQIKLEEDPNELRAWAEKIFALYATNQIDLPMQITNAPPREFPASKYGPTILLEKSDANSSIPHLFLIWKFTRARGLYIGETNYVRSDGEIWKPGIYFYTEP
jgi:hypothetical protein